MKRFYVLLGVVAVVGAAAVWYGTRGGGVAVVEPIELGDLNDADVVSRALFAWRGDPDAKITIIEFGDYQCPGCRHFATSVKPFIDMTYVEEGIAKFEYRDFPLEQHPHAFLAARASWCANDLGQDTSGPQGGDPRKGLPLVREAYWEYHDALFRNQREWSAATNASRHFNRYADELGLDGGDFRRCLASDRHAEGVTASLMLGQRWGIGGTPAVVVNLGDGRPLMLGAADFGQIQAVIEGESEN